MCGIAGIFNLNGAPIAHRTIKAMTDSIAHRGPDGEGHYIDVNVALGHRRLAIIDLSPKAAQPMASPNGDVVVSYDGEIYNFLKLKAELQARGHNFVSRSDTEVLIHGYLEYGISFVERLNGMFAFALWDARKRTLYLARDRYGIKPLYWRMKGSTFVFASEIKAILTHPEVSAELNPDALNEYFTFQNLFRYHTLFKGINLLQAASVRWINEKEKRLEKRTWWDFNFTDRDNQMTAQEAEDETLRLLRQAVTRQLISDVPLGSYLSGGIDSGSLVAVASENIPRFATFTCGFQVQTAEGVEAEYDERRDAEFMANHFKTEHYEQVVSSSDLPWALPRVVWHIEDLRLGMSYPNYYISRLASKFVKVCLSGAGGDELYGGYPWRYYRVFRSVSRDDYFRQYYDFWQRLVTDQDKQRLFTQGIWHQVKERDTFRTFSRVFTFNEKLKYDRPEDHIANALYFEIKTFLPALFIVGDKLSMANSLEERVPFLDNDLVDFAQRVPIKYKLGDLKEMKKIDENEVRKLRRYQVYDDGKNVLRKAMSHLVPQEIIKRKKQGFSSPDESWYRGENIKYVKETLLNKRAAYRDFINPGFVEKTITEHCEQKQNKRLLLWSLLCFEHWCRIFLDGWKPQNG
ncbi:MAG: asparagine synthase (glutamine-hydrolyzing) [Deltaproteobacteria bacterium]|nr:MAG: asparagine synthase (glutamine-hydrolyzing) [Deltaproteobacteria bacterium]